MNTSEQRERETKPKQTNVNVKQKNSSVMNLRNVIFGEKSKKNQLFLQWS